MNLESNNHRYSLVCFCVLIIGILLRSIHLDADPYYYEWAGYITDEGRWVQQARSLALHGTLVGPYLTNVNFSLAPLFQLSNYLVFELLGVSLLTSRIFTALCGSALLILFCAILRHRVSPQALLLGITLLAVQTDLVVLSRVAVPEMVILFFQLVIYFVIVSDGHSSWRMVLSGFLFLAGCAMKATIALLLPIFSVMILAMPRKPTEMLRWRDLTLFWIGFAGPALLAGLIFYSLPLDTAYNDVVKNHLLTIKPFLKWSGLYDVVSLPFTDPLSGTINIWSLGLWLTALGWCSVARAEIDFRSYRYLATSAIWIIGYFLLALNLEYFPTRYKVHVLLPMALFITVGVHVIERIGMRRIIDSLAEAKGSLGLLGLPFASVPTAVFLSPLLVSAAALLGIDAERLATKLLCISSLMLAITYVAHRVKHNRQVIAFLLTFPLVEGIAWMVSSTLANAYPFWPTVEFPSHAAVFSLMILTAMGLSVIFVECFLGSRQTEGSYAITAVAVVCLIIMAARLAPGYVNPHFSMREVSRDLGSLLVNFSTITAVRTDTLFNENKLRYKSSQDVVWPPEKTQIVVTAFSFDDWKDILDRGYHVMKRYRVFVSPEWYRSRPHFVTEAPAGVTVIVYKRNDEGKSDF